MQGVMKQMTQKQRYTKMKNKYVYIFIFVCIFIVIPLPFIYKLINPISRISSFLEENDPTEAVEYYNDKNFSDKNKSRIDDMLGSYIDDIKNQYNNSSLTAEDCIKALEILKNVKNDELTEKANDVLTLIRSEDEGKAALANATELLSEKKYTDAMKTIKGISRSYSDYDKLKEIYTRSRDEVKKKAENPETIEEYKESIEILDECIEETEDEILIEEKEQLTTEYEEQKEVYETIIEASDSYEKESYKDTFSVLENEIKKHPDNEKLKKAKEFFENAYVVQVSEEVISYAETEDYTSAQRVMNEAIKNYNSPELQEIIDQISSGNISYENINEKIMTSKEAVLKAAMDYIPEKYSTGLSEEEITNMISNISLKNNTDLSDVISQIKKDAGVIIKQNN